MYYVGPVPKYACFIYDEGECDIFAVDWNGNEWITAVKADLRGWYFDPLNEDAYEYLLKHYGLDCKRNTLTFEIIKKMSPQKLVDARRELEKKLNLKPMDFTEGRDY